MTNPLAAWTKLRERGSPGLWVRYHSSPTQQHNINEVQDSAGEAVIGWSGFDDSSRSFAEHDSNAQAAVIAVNNFGALLEGVGAQQELLACYRLGKQPSVLLFDRLNALDTALTAIQQQLTEAGNV